MQTSRPTKGELVVFVLVGQAPEKSIPLLLNSAGKQRNFGILAPMEAAAKCMAGFAASESAQSETIVRYRNDCPWH